MRTTFLGLGFVVGVVMTFGAACGSRDRTHPTPDPDAQMPSDGATGDAIDAPPPTGKLCGGFSGEMCAANEYCDYVDNHCGIADGAGTCKRRPDACPALVGRPVCGCDDKVHTSDCIAYSDGVDLNADGCSAVPAGSFACGYAVCTLATQYCRRDTKPADADVYTCVTLPQGCPAGAPSCECLRAEPCGLACSGNEKTGLTVTCQ